MPELVAPRWAHAGDLGDRVALTSWPNYHDPKNFEKFTAATGVTVKVRKTMILEVEARGAPAPANDSKV